MSDRLKWFKSSYSDNEGGACVEVAHDDAVHIRDSKSAASGPELQISPGSWSAFIAAVRPEA
ncbi:DUF397 domain-containing protein [Streptomyces sp. WAC 04229]|uniref:DUF397 domain-containing protein n=1 Tax=Streptomyces sp. WAC 04229 TaxID=2203206 RepID=UPI000F74145D|nr:DUF397 domain-containing protein [Streptomyces sp. WAC 04229]RSN41688.1 DUF397 domain-containing protein [Streptomyces sp. WAC 04229]